MLSFVDTLAFLVGFIFILKKQIQLTQNERWVIKISLVAYSTACMTAAVTNEFHPHALRSLGAWPFVCLITGVLIFRLTQKIKYFVYIVTLLAASFLIWYQFQYFVKYPAKAAFYFDQKIVNAARLANESDNWPLFISNFADYPIEGRIYYLLRYKKINCQNFISAKF